MARQRKIIIISGTSDIGARLCEQWAAEDELVLATFRTTSTAVQRLEEKGVHMVHCDLGDRNSIRRSLDVLVYEGDGWDILIFCAGTMEPIGPFMQCDIEVWTDSVGTNFLGQLHLVHQLLPVRNLSSRNGPCVLFFAGGGTNSAPVNFSAYTVAKIGLIKMCELLDAEIDDTRFSIIGPGWVKTKIHEETLRAGEQQAGSAYDKTRDKLQNNKEWVSMTDVVACCNWVVDSDKKTVGGRNFSVAHDQWRSEQLSELLKKDPDMYKLRRAGNEVLTR